MSLSAQLNWQILPLRALADNYIWLMTAGKLAVVVDPGDSQVVLDYLQAKELDLQVILLTHAHADHIGGVAALQAAYPSVSVIDNFQQQLQDDQEIVLLPGLTAKVILTPGHTSEHVVYFINQEHLFCGDCLFSLGCGRVFTQDYAAAFSSLQKLKQLPASCYCYPAHEYTASNLRFTLSIDQQPEYYQAFADNLNAKLTSGQASLPSSLADELYYNLFLRCHEPRVWQMVASEIGQPIVDEFDCFYHLRQLRNNF